MVEYKSKINDFIENCWEEVAIRLKDNLVFLDQNAARCLHWHGGLEFLLGNGALNAKEFSSFEHGTVEEKNALFILTQPVSEEVEITFHSILSSSHFRSCTVILSHDPSVYIHASNQQVPMSGVPKDYSYLKNKLQYWLMKKLPQNARENCSVDVIHIPIFFCSITPNLFLLPSFYDMFPPLVPEESKVKEKESKGSGDPIKSETSLMLQYKIKTLSFCLQTLLNNLKIREDIFSLGPFSHDVALEIEQSPVARNRKKVMENKASLLIIDRTVDMVGCLSQNTDSFFDIARRVLPSLPGHDCDVAISMASFCKAKINGDYENILAPGCLCPPSTEKFSRQCFQMLINNKQKEYVMELNRCLLKESLKGTQGKDIPKVGTDPIKNLDIFMKNSSAVQNNLGLLQQALGYQQILQNPLYKKLDELNSTEQLLIQNMGVSAEGPCRNIVQLVNNIKKGNFTVEDILIFIALLYVLSGTDSIGSPEDEEAMQASLIEIILQQSEKLPTYLAEYLGDLEDENETIASIRRLFSHFKEVGNTRKDYKKFKSLFQDGDSITPSIYIPLLKQILDEVFTSKTDLMDIEYHSSRLTDLLKSGLSFFTNVKKQQPRDNPCLILFVIGGVTAKEVRLIKEVTEMYRESSTEVLVFSTGLITPSEAMQSLIKIIPR